MKNYIYSVEMETRDYECDIQGIVNNANYQHYFEATRHQWLKHEGFSFQKWHDEGIDVVVSEITIKYKTPLKGQEEFVSCLNLRRNGARFIFEQDIYRKADMKLCVSGEVTAVCLIDGVLTRGDELAAKFPAYFK
ncbi:MAG: acyl-CoA thioesterase [Bacteroidales bacterium]|nr:acyl-CoA thioesterase [Bacteroidales bacterium]